MIAHAERLELTPFQARARAEVARGIPWAVMADRGGYVKRGEPDVWTLQIQLGLRKRGARSGYAQWTSYAEGPRLARAIDADPVDVGL